MCELAPSPAEPDVRDDATLETRSGLMFDLRPVMSSDEAALTAFFDKLTDEDRRFRFLSGIVHVAPSQIAPVLHPDHFRSESWLAFERDSGDLAASGMLACDGPLENAEIAVSINASYRAKGLGWAMLNHLSSQAQKRGCRRVFSIELRENRAAIALERELGFVAEPCDDDPALVLLTRDLR